MIMAKTLTDQLRQAIDASALTRYRICKEIGWPESGMSRFMAGKAGVSSEVLDRLGELLGLHIVADVKVRKRGQAKPAAKDR